MKKLLNHIFPNSCLYCNKIINPQSFFCSSCWPKLKFITKPNCPICSYPFEFESISLICAKCLEKRPDFDKNISIFEYNYIIKKAISNLKYHDQLYLGKKLAKLLITYSKLDFKEFDIITNVPSHKKQLLKRKYNQSILLAKNICKITKSNNFYANLTIKTKNTKAQTSLNKKQRQENLKSAFEINPKYQNFIKNKNILIIDDVITTNTTANMLSKILKKHKAKKITILTIARTKLN